MATDTEALVRRAYHLAEGAVVAIEVSIQGTFLGPFETPDGVIACWRKWV